MRWLVPVCFGILLGAPVSAQEPRSDFAICMDRTAARFEMELARSDNRPGAPDLRLLSQRDTRICGSAGIVACDLSDDRIPCQTALAADQDALRAQVLATLPGPEAPAGLAAQWSDGLYPTLWEIAHGTSAGPDCAATRPIMRAWCETNQASGKLAEAVMLWQLARLLGIAEPAVAAGWAEDTPIRPEPRPIE